MIPKRKILLALSGGIACYKAADLVRQLKSQNFEVRVAMSQGAQQFITPLTLQALSGQPVFVDLLDEQAEAAMGHIELARWPDHILIAPATANIIARLAHGFADDLITTLCLATDRRISVAPAMNRLMWQHPATQANVQCLAQRGVTILGPGHGSQACGETGPGRMLEPTQLVTRLQNQFCAGTGDWPKRRLLITAGPTREPLDPVRYLTNRSSGRMGYAIAQQAALLGAEVCLISGPVALPVPANVQLVAVETAHQMHQAVLDQLARQEWSIFIATAAVADYGLVPAPQKIKKKSQQLTLTLTPNPDILATVAQRDNPPFCVGFAAETTHVIDYARDKMQRKKLDMICANQVGPEQGFDQPSNELTVLWPQGQKKLPLMAKDQLAQHLLALIDQHYRQKSLKPPDSMAKR